MQKSLIHKATRVAIIASIILILLGVFTMQSSEETVTFEEVYMLQVSEQIDTLKNHVSIPSHADNVLRQELGSLLTSLLTNTALTSEERLSLALRARSINDRMRIDIENIDTYQLDAGESIGDLEERTTVFDRLFSRGQKHTHIIHLRKYVEETDALQSTLLSMNNETNSIIEQIIADAGALTENHINLINESTHYAQDRFDDLEQGYKKLEEMGIQIDREFDRIVSTK